MKYEGGVELHFPARYESSFERWEEDDAIALVRTVNGHAVLLTHGSPDGTLDCGDGTTVEPEKLIDLLAEQVGEPKGDVFVICCFPGCWDDFQYSESCAVSSFGEWEIETSMSRFEQDENVIGVHVAPRR